MKTNKLLTVLLFLFAAATLKAESVDSTFTINGLIGKIAMHLQLPANFDGKKVPMVIICHGLGGNQNEPFISKIAADVLKEGMGVVRFDLNGHGKSDGEFINMDALNIQDDMRRVIAWTSKQPFTKKYISLQDTLWWYRSGYGCTGSGKW